MGRHLVWRLATQAGRLNHSELIFTGRNAAAAAQVMQALPPAAREAVRYVELDHGSATAASRLREAAAGADAVVHCAALASPWGRKALFRRANIDSTWEVLAACAAHGITRLVHISTPSIYFSYHDRLGITEDGPLPPPATEYARSKRQAELMVLAAALPHGVMLRPRAIFGPWDQTLLPRLLRLMQYGRVPLLRGGRALLDMSYVDNVVDAVLLSLQVPAAAHTRVFNISNGEPVAAVELFARLAASFALPIAPAPRPYWLADLAARALELGAHLAPGWEPPVTRYSLGTIAYSQTLDLHKARSELNYAPAVSLDEGIARTAAWWKAQHA